MAANVGKWARQKLNKMTVGDPDIKVAEGDDTTQPKSKASGRKPLRGGADDRDPEQLAAIRAQLPTYSTEADDLSEILGMVRKASSDAGTVKPLVLDACDALGACIQLQLSNADLLLHRLTTDSHFSSEQVKQRATIKIGEQGAAWAGNAVAVENSLRGAIRSELNRGADLYRAGILSDPELQQRAKAAATAAVDALEALRIGNQRARTDATLPDGFGAMRSADAQALLAAERIRYQCSQQQPSTLLAWYRDACDRRDEQRQLDLEYGIEGHVRGLISGGLEVLKKASRKPGDLDRSGEATKMLNDCYAVMNAIEQQRAARFPQSVLLGEHIAECLTGVFRVVVGIDPRHSSRALVESTYLTLDGEGKSLDGYAIDPSWLVRIGPGYLPWGPLEADGYHRRRAPTSGSPWLIEVLDSIKRPSTAGR